MWGPGRLADPGAQVERRDEADADEAVRRTIVDSVEQGRDAPWAPRRPERPGQPWLERGVVQ